MLRAFVIRASCFFRHSTFVLRHSADLDQSICANCEQEHRANKRVALEKRAIDSCQIAFFGSVLVNKRHRDQRQRPVVERPELRDESKSDERDKREQM